MTTGRPSRRRYDASLAIDAWLGPLICAVLLAWKRLVRRSRSAPEPESARRIALLKMWGMGSIVLASPLLSRLRSRYPNARIDFVTLKENEAIVALYPEIDRVVTIDLSRGVASFLRETVAVMRRLRAERYDLLLDLEFFTRFSAIFSFLVSPRWSHGFSAKGKWRGRLHDAEVPFNAYAHVTQNFLTLLAADAMSPIDPAEIGRPNALPLLAPPAEAWERCRSRLEAEPQWRRDHRLVVVNPNAGDMALERRWPTERFAELLVHITDQLPANVVVIGAPSERGRAEAVIRVADLADRVINLAGRSDVPELVSLLAHADVLVTNDSGPMHIAAAVGTSCVALFGPETPVLYAPLCSAPGQHHAVHYLGLRCSPCMFVHDNKVLSCWFSQARCMTGIGVPEVFASVHTLLAGEAATSPHSHHPREH